MIQKGLLCINKNQGVLTKQGASSVLRKSGSKLCGLIKS